jgi:hypothetical protein
MFVSAIYVVQNNSEVNPADAFMSLFCIMFGATHAGTAAGMGPDIGKATVALIRIFEFIRYPSSINACAMDESTAVFTVRLNLDKVQGKIEF